MPATPPPYDVIVVGARCAGSPTAMLLAREGWRVLLLDRATFPSDTVSSHYIHEGGVARLARWGILPAIADIPTPLIPGIRIDLNMFTLSATPGSSTVDQDVAACGPPRVLLDAILVDAAAAAGAEVRQDCAVTELLWEHDRVAGVCYRTAGGAICSDRATMVVGADGKHSKVAREVGAQAYDENAPVSCGIYAHWAGFDVHQLEVWVGVQRVVIAFPTVDGLTCIYVGFPHRDEPTVRHDDGAAYVAALAGAPALREHVDKAERVTPLRGSGDLGTYYRQSVGPGWALVGDAGHHQDPLLAQGISNALSDAEAVAQAISQGLRDPSRLAPALTVYQQDRDAARRPLDQLGRELASFNPSTDVIRLLVALQANPTATQSFFDALSGTTPPTQFFTHQDAQLGAGTPHPT